MAAAAPATPNPPQSAPAAAPITGAPAPTDPANRVMAREFATRGAEAFDRGAFAEALDDFNRAAALFDAPTIAIMQARTLIKLGRWLAGLDRLQQTARQVLAPSDPAPFHDAVRQAAVEGEALRQQLPQLSVLMEPSLQSQVTVELDGQTLPSLLLNTSRPIDPGSHRLKATKGGVAFLERSVETPPGQHVEIQVALPVAKPVIAAAPPTHVALPSPPPPTTLEAQETEPNWSLIGVAAIGGLGAVGAGLATAIGSAAKARLDDECERPTRCSALQQRDIDTLETSRTLFYVSSAMFVIGGSLTAYLLLTDESNDGDQTQLSLSPFGAQLTTIF